LVIGVEYDGRTVGAYVLSVWYRWISVCTLHGTQNEDTWNELAVVMGIG